MITKMRTMAPVIMMVILVAFVIGTILMDWGMNRGSQGSQMMNAGKVNGRAIPLQTFDNEVNLERQKLEESGRSPDQLQYHMVPRKVWERKVNELLMADFFRRVHLNATPDEIFNYIKNNPVPGIDTVSAFLTNGVFDTSKYIAFLNDPRTYEYNPGFRELEQYARDMILPAAKLEVLLSASLLPTQTEIDYQYRLQHDKVVFEYASVNPAAFKPDSAAVTEDMMKACYSSRRDSFAIGEQVSLYSVKVKKNPTARDYEIYRQEFAEIKERVMALPDTAREEMFAEEARVSSDDESNAQNGGDLGLFKRGTMVPEFDSVAFSLPIGTVSDPVLTRFGYHLIYVMAREKTGNGEQAKARHILRRIVPTMETLDELTETIDTLRSRMQEKGFCEAAREAAARDTAILFDSTGFFERGGMIPGIGYVSGVGRFAFSNENKEGDVVSERLENKDGLYLFAVKRRISKGTAPFEVVKPRIRRMLLDSLRDEQIRAFAGELATHAENAPALAALRERDTARIVSGVTDTMPVGGYVPGIGANTVIAAVARALPIGKTSGLIKTRNGYSVVRTLWKSPAAEIPAESPDVAMIVNQYMAQAKQRLYMDWYDAYKKKARIESNIDKIYID
ncbi:MAG: peptidylprolyl isomerase [Chitinispirillaceae bacterium]|nr:peptidylprolyl isomerase [Chitinispirillaceae bacterium]